MEEQNHSCQHIGLVLGAHYKRGWLQHSMALNSTLQLPRRIIVILLEPVDRITISSPQVESLFIVGTLFTLSSYGANSICPPTQQFLQIQISRARLRYHANQKFVQFRKSDNGVHLILH